jgi:pimeloyl-ACP methyl ester carboxylesterase
MGWTNLAQALESDYDVVMPDTRGHGASGNFPKSLYTIQTLAIDLVKVK